MAVLGTLTFGGVVGSVPPRTQATVEPIATPAGAQAAVVFASPRLGRLEYMGWFAADASPRAAISSLVGTVTSVTDETGRTLTALIVHADVRETPALRNGVQGLWVEATIDAWEWPAP